MIRTPALLLGGLLAAAMLPTATPADAAQPAPGAAEPTPETARPTPEATGTPLSPDSGLYKCIYVVRKIRIDIQNRRPASSSGVLG